MSTENTKSKYVYKIPEGKCFNLSRRQFNTIFIRKHESLIKSLFTKHVAFVSDDSITIEHLPTFMTKVLTVVLSPFLCFMYGYSEVKETVIKTFNARRYGYYYADTFWSGHKSYNEIKAIIDGKC